MKERRQHKRYRLKKLAYAEARDPATAFMGQVMEIAHGGVTVHSFSQLPTPANGAMTLDLFCSANGHRLEDVSIRLVSTDDIQSPFPHVKKTKKRYGLAFNELQDTQAEMLDQFIHRFCFFLQ